MNTSFLFKAFISVFVAFGVMSKYLFEQYSDMALAGHAYNHGVEAGVADAFMYFMFAVLIGIIIWFASMFILSFVERLLFKRSGKKRRVREEEGDVFHD